MTTSTATRHAETPSEIDERVLTRVRKLLAQAEHPTTSPEEAEAFSAKAAELMAKYVVDASLLDQGHARAAPVARRLVVHGPYSMPKVMLLTAVSDAYGVRAIAAAEFAGARECTLIGFTTDIEAVEVLFTSLLLQAWSAMNHASRGATRPRAFRRAFLLGYAGTIGERLREVTRRVTDEAVQDNGGGAELVLASRAAEVDAAVRQHFPRLRSLRTTISDSGGLAAGRQAGRQASLSGASSALAR